jgi:hypothetical protein
MDFAVVGSRCRRRPLSLGKPSKMGQNPEGAEGKEQRTVGFKGALRKTNPN